MTSEQQSIRSTIIAEAERQNLTAYAIALRAELPANTVKRYFNGERDLTSERLEKVCGVLGLELRRKKRG